MDNVTCCKNGHEYTNANTFMYRGYRMCRTCRSNNAVSFRKRHKARVNTWHKDNYAINAEEIKAYKRRYRKEGRHKTALYNLSKSYDQLLIDQKNCCASCFRERTVNEIFMVDHDHSCCSTTKKSCGKCVRGLVCRSCNTALGFVKDSKKHLQQLIDYLERYDKRKR